MRSGWYLGSESFKDWLLKLMEKPVVGRRGSLSGPAVRDRSLHEAQRLVTEGAKLVDLALDEVALAGVAKGDRGQRWPEVARGGQRWPVRSEYFWGVLGRFGAFCRFQWRAVLTRCINFVTKPQPWSC